ncbi:MAG: TIR domain-containing protein, partial [Bacilli bacterium]|nr:TIR domain-containing protein [Bacilli bacterium]
MKKRVFISFDYDHDSDIKGSLVGQAKLDDSPFDIVDLSIKEAIDARWKENARRRIKSCDCVIVLCGKYT